MTSLLLLIALASPVDRLGCPRPAAIHAVALATQEPDWAPTGDDCRASLAALNARAQAKVLRPAGVERLSPAAVSHYRRLVGPLSPEQRITLWAAFAELGDLQAMPPARQTYDRILIYGSTVQTMRRRVMFLAEAVRRGAVQLTEGAPRATAHCLMISDNPFIAYQQAVTRQLLGDACTQLDAAGPEAPVHGVSEEVALGILLDTLARTVYTEMVGPPRL